MLRRGIVPRRGSTRLAIFQGLIFSRGGHLAVPLIELAPDLVADNAASHGANSGSGNGPASIAAGDGSARSAAGNGAYNRACALLVPWSASSRERGQYRDCNDGR
jgi:hypothetical protein